MNHMLGHDESLDTQEEPSYQVESTVNEKLVPVSRNITLGRLGRDDGELTVDVFLPIQTLSSRITLVVAVEYLEFV